MDDLTIAQTIRDNYPTFRRFKDVNFSIIVDGRSVDVNIGQEINRQEITVTLWFRKGLWRQERRFVVYTFDPITIAQLIKTQVY